MDIEKSNGSVSETDKQNYSEKKQKYYEDKGQLKEIIPVEGTPFHIIKNDDKYFVVMGMFKISQILATLEDAIEEAEQISWNKIINVVQAMIESHDFYQKNENQTEIDF